MDVKKTKNGKFSFEVTWFQRNQIFYSLLDFLETETVNLLKVRLNNEEGLMRHLYATYLNEFINRREFHLNNPAKIRWTIKRSEALAIMWVIRLDNDLGVLELKSALHKSLS